MAVKKTATKKGAQTKLQAIMGLTGQSIRANRNAILYKRLSSENAKKIAELLDMKDDVEIKIMSHTDLAPNSRDSLKVKEIDAASWNETLAGYYGELRDINDSLEIYQDIQGDYFTEKTPEELEQELEGVLAENEEQEQE